MKTKNTLLIALLVLLTGMASCQKDHDIPTGKVFNGGEVHTDSVVDYEKLLVGTWGVEKIEYYNLDYAGNPILSSLKTINLDPSSTDNGIQMIFREDKTGEIRDSSIDTLWVEESSYIVCPDTILVKAFTYYYDKSDSLLNVSMTNSLVPHKMDVKELTNNTFVYENEYSTNYMEKAYLKRLSDEPLPPLESYTVNVSTNPSNGGVVSGGGTYLHGQNCTVTATANADYTFTYWTENEALVSLDATYSFTVEADRALVAKFAVSGVDGHAFVDLGLPSNTLWATCNVGANTPEDYGRYFAWGETQTKSEYSWSTYQYCNGSSSTLTKYCYNSDYGYNGFTDNLTILLPEDDAATANWGQDWRMPTSEEWNELLNYTTNIWTTQNGVKGRLFTASNGNSLFLPAAGYRIGSSLNYAGSCGYYWSGSLNTVYPRYAWELNFNSDNGGMSNYDRDFGQSVRPVRSVQN